MGKPEIALNPPAPTAKAVLAHRKKLEAERDALRTGAAELALKSAQGDTAAQAVLWGIPAKLTGLQFEIDQNHAAHELATKHDGDAYTGWRASILTLEPEDIIAGIGGDGCCRLCAPGTPGGCLLSAGKSSECQHPVRELRSANCDETGRKIFRFRDDPQAARIFDAACKKLKVKRGGIGQFP